MADEKTNDFLEKEKLGRLVVKYSIPCIISLLVGALYNIVDQIFIANASYLGSYGNAANTVVYPLTVIALAIALMIGDGCCALVSLCLGAGRKKSANRSVGNAIVLAIVCGIVIMAIYLIFKAQILTMFGATVNEETFRLSKEYFFYIALGVPFYMFGQALNPIIRSDGSPRFAMITLLAGCFVNIIFDPICIFIFKWGMMGAAIATVAGQVVAAVMSLIYLFHMKVITISRDSFRMSRYLLKRMLPLGITSFLAQISIVISMLVTLNLIKKYGAMDPIYGQEEYSQIPTAVIGIVTKFFQIVLSIAIGLVAGCMPVVGYNIGARRNDRAKGLFKILIITEAVVGAIAFAIFELFPNQLIAIFGASNESSYYVDFAVRCIRVFLCSIILGCINKGIAIYLQALGRALESTVLSVLRDVVCGIAFAAILPIFFGLNGLICFMPASDVVTIFVSVAVISHTFKKLDNTGSNQAGEIKEKPSKKKLSASSLE